MSFALALAALLATPAAPRIGQVRLDRAEVRQYERGTVTFSLSGHYDNPYDAGQIRADCVLIGPGGRKMTVPCFWHVPYRPADDFTRRHIFTNPGRELYEPAGPGRWEARISLPEAGLWHGRIVASDRTGEGRSREFAIRCLPREAHGYLRPASNGWFLQFDDGAGFVPVGLCIAWARGSDKRDCYDYLLPRLAAAGGNTVRVWMCHWAWLEWTRADNGALRGYAGVGRYNQQVAFNFDRLVALAERAGIYLQICFNNACWEFGRPDGKHDAYDSWGGNPYNAKNGGPCRKPGDFWTNAEARRLYRNKLRYIVARWGYSTHVLAWELWNEVGSEGDASAAWHEEMAAYLRRIDPWHHPVTTSSWCSDPADNRRTFTAMDIVQLHYAGLDAIDKAKRLFPHKPVIVGEGPWQRHAMIKAGYGSPLHGAAGPPLTWFDASARNIDFGAALGLVRAFARLSQGFPASAARVRRLQASDVTADAADARFAPVVIHPGFNTWLKRSTQSRFVVPPDGRVETSGMSNRLYGSNPDRRPYRNPPTFIVNYPIAGEFAVRVGECSGPAVLIIKIDGHEALRFNVPGGGRRSPPDHLRWQAVSVPPGRHEITVDNAGHDWMAIGPFVLTNYRDVSRYPPVELAGIAADGRARLWVVNQWADVARALKLPPAPKLRVRATWQALADGRWTVRWHDPESGRVVAEQTVTSAGGRATFRCSVADIAVASAELQRQSAR